MTSPTKKKNFPIFFHCNLRLETYFECLNSSLAQSAQKLWRCKVAEK